MKLSLNSGSLYPILGTQKTIDYAAKAGFDAIDFSFSETYFNELQKEKSYYIDLKKYANDKGLFFNQAHAPAPSSNISKEKSKELFNDIVFSIKSASYLGVKNIVVHPCQHLRYIDKDAPEMLFEYNMDFYKRLIPYAEEYDIRIAIENMWQYPGMISHSTCSTPDEMIRYVDTLNNDSIVCCLDVGHAMLVRQMPDDFIRALGNKRLACLHIHDVDGTNDSHTMPYLGIINWEKTMQSLAEIGYTGDLTYEVKSADFKNKPIQLLQDYVNLLSSTGRHLISIYEGK